ncbi:hypothetical protein P389DRAFT_191051 [Cystobasidium minutum MCA 4210]|uniref:uncharacterized protein n=1 Tax=Cystobasidium minutum MCA 4210 TaxID=1397322 RepID=UPI0034CD9D9E|eukprot:jgi/Rhomi1/191051/estExt_fgenesh1_pg.C_70023
MELDDPDTTTVAKAEDYDNDTSSFDTVFKTIKVLEMEWKARDKQRQDHVEQERLQWQREKEELLAQLRRKQSPYKVPKSPARPVLGARSPNKQPVSAATTTSQAASDLSFQDIFSPTKSVSKGDPSARQANGNTNVTPSKRHATTNGTKSPNYRKLREELESTQKELKRVKHKYYALYEAQEEILRKRNKDRDRWRHFKSVVKHVCAIKPEFQDALKEADALLKQKNEQSEQEQQQETSGLDERLEKAPTKLVNGPASKMAATSTITTPATIAETVEDSIRHRTAQPQTSFTSTPRRNLHTPGRRMKMPPPDQPVLSPRPLSSPPQSPSPRKRTIHASQLGSLTSRGTEEGRSNEYVSASPAQALFPTATQRISSIPAPFSSLADRHSSPPSQHEAGEEIDRPKGPSSSQERAEYLDWQAEAALRDAEMQAERDEEREIALYQLAELESQRRSDARITAGHAIDDILSTSRADDGTVRRNQRERSPFPSQPSTCDNLTFWSQERKLAEESASQQSVPSDVEFGSYVPSTAGSVTADVTLQQAADRSLADNAPAYHQEDSSSTDRIGVSLGTSPYFANQAKSASRTGAIPYIFPLPEDLQPHISPDVDMLEESVPVHRANRPRFRNSSILTPTSVSREHSVQTSKVLEIEKDGNTAREPAGAVGVQGPDDEATEPSSESSEEANATVKHDVVIPSESCTKEIETTDTAMPSSAAVTASTVTSLHAVTDPEVTAQHVQVMQVSTRVVTIKEASGLPRLSSYRAFKDADSDGEATARSMSDDRIGPRRALASTSTSSSRPSAARTVAGRAVGLPEDPKEDLCEALYAKITSGPSHPQITTAPTPLGKAILPQQKIPPPSMPRGTPTAWLNMSSKKRINMSGTPTHSAVSSSSKRAPEISKASETVRVRQIVVEEADRIATSIDRPQVVYKTTQALLGREVRKEDRGSPSLRAKHQTTAPRVNATEVAAGMKKTTIKKSRKSALVTDPDVQSDLDVIGAAILKGDGSTFRLGAKRTIQDRSVQDDQIRKKGRKSNEQTTPPYDGSFGTEKSLGPQPNSKKTGLDHAAGKSSRRQTAAEELSDRSVMPAIKQEVADLHTSAHVKVEDNESDTLEDESEEYEGQHFLRHIHKMRNREMAERLARKNAQEIRGEYEVEHDDEPPKQVAYKETVRGREARQKMHGVDCDCCKGYYEYKTRNLPLEQRQQAAAEMANDVSRHRQNHETAESPPGFWQMGFPSTQDVERINQEAEKIINEKQEKLRKEKKISRENQCEGRFAYKVV